jgi:1,4-alpha-glucan branching enzyme
MHKGTILLLLHAHLPYVRHPEHDYFLEENWFYEAVVEAYIPLLDTIERLIEEEVDFRLTMSLSPTLLEMLSDRLLSERLLRHINALLELTEKEIKRTRKDASLNPLARMYNERIKRIKHIYEDRCGRDIVGALRALDSSGRMEFITTAATHAFLPNLSAFPDAAGGQVGVGLAAFKAHMGRSPGGFWLPECGYHPGLDTLLSDTGMKFCFLEAHGVLHGRPRARHGVFMPVRCPSGLAAFGRDSATVRKVWCAGTGYPGHPDYREFYRDIGYDLPMRYIRPYIHPDGIRIPTGIKYHRVTGPTENKQPYDRGRALARAAEHAHSFISDIRRRAAGLQRKHGLSPLIVAPFDAELFGHWWFEGPEWLGHLMKGLASQKDLRPVTPSEFLARGHDLQGVSPGLSSWGEGGYSATWAGKSTGWALGHLFRACERMGRLAAAPNPAPLEERVLNQAFRELLLAQASDWPFLMHRDTSARYAEARLTGHLENFSVLYEMLARGPVDMARLEEMEKKAPLFPWLDYRSYVRSFA